MRADDEIGGSLFSYIDLEQRVPIDHPLRAIREIANAALETLSRDFTRLYSGMGRPSIAPEKLLQALFLQADASNNLVLSDDLRRADRVDGVISVRRRVQLVQQAAWRPLSFA
jgi:hypothetical protein